MSDPVVDSSNNDAPSDWSDWPTAYLVLFMSCRAADGWESPWSFGWPVDLGQFGEEEQAELRAGRHVVRPISLRDRERFFPNVSLKTWNEAAEEGACLCVAPPPTDEERRSCLATRALIAAAKARPHDDLL